MPGDDVKKTFVVVFLSGIVGAFAAGVTAIVFVEARIKAGVKQELSISAPPLIQTEVQKQLSSALTVGHTHPSRDVPIGTVLAYWGTEADLPPGFLPCAGQTLSKHDYSDLFEHFERFSATLPDERFVLPDLRGEFIRGLDNGRSVDIDRVLGSFQTDSFEAHVHRYAYGNGDGPVQGPWAHNHGQSHGQNRGRPDALTQPAGEETETRPRNVALLYIMKVAN
ncbi:MAG: phage tail protein [Planctomycetota bacterium]